MSVQPLCLAPDGVLRTLAHPVEEFTEALQALVRDLIDTMYANGGVGLAAPQIGQAMQGFVTNPSRERGRELVVVNPTLEAMDGRVVVTEGCLSVPNFWRKVRRSKRIRVRGQDPFGKPLDIEANGLLAITVQHEWDHLHGTLFIDRLPWFERLRLRGRLASRACA